MDVTRRAVRRDAADGPGTAGAPDAAGPGAGAPPAWRRWAPRLSAAALVVVAAVTCWAVFVRQTRIETSRLAALVVHTPHMSGVAAKPAVATAQPPAKSTLGVVRRAGSADPGHTGIYEAEWQAPAKATQANAGLLVLLLPTASQAAQALDQVRKQYGASRSVSGDTYTLTGHFAVPGVAGATGIVYHVAPAAPATPSPSNPAGTARIVLFRVGTAAVVEIAQTVGTSQGTAGAVALAAAEAAHLGTVLPGFGLGVTTRPVGESVGVLAGGAAAALAVATAPGAVGGWRRRRLRRRREREERVLRQSGSSRAIRRRRVPAWQRAGATRRRLPWWPQR